MWCVAITGPPGSGKSPLAKRLADFLKEKGLKVCGITCPDVRVKGRRIGFKVIDLVSGEEAWLARVDCEGPRVGRYRLCEGAEELAKRALSREDCDVYLIDEIGPMELKQKGFREAMLKAIKSGKPFIAVYHVRLSDKEFLSALKRCFNIYLTKDEREIAYEKALKYLESVLNEGKER